MLLSLTIVWDLSFLSRWQDCVSLSSTSTPISRNWHTLLPTEEGIPTISNSLNFHRISTFKTNILKFIRPVPNSIFNCHHPRLPKLLTRLRIGLNNLRKHKFKHSFQDTFNPFCCCRNGETESVSHYLFLCLLYLKKRTAFLDNANRFYLNVFDRRNLTITQTILFSGTIIKRWNKHQYFKLLMILN